MGQIYLLANPLLTEPRTPAHIKPRLLGHWGTSPGLNLVHTHLNRVIKAVVYALCVRGPGHGGPAGLANSWLEDAYSETYPRLLAGRGRDGEPGVRQSPCSPRGAQPCRARDPGSIHEGGELGYSLAMPTGPRSTTRTCWSPVSSVTARRRRGRWPRSWHLNKFLDPVHDGACGAADPAPQRLQDRQPTVLSRIPEAELDGVPRRAATATAASSTSPWMTPTTGPPGAMADVFDRALDTALMSAPPRTACPSGCAGP